MKLYHQYLLKSAFIPSKNRFIRDFFDRLFGQPHQKGVNKTPSILNEQPRGRAIRVSTVDGTQK